MWALRRASYSFQNRGFCIRTSRPCCAQSKESYLDEKASNGYGCPVILDGRMSLKRFCGKAHGSPNSFIGQCSFTSQADVTSSEQEEEDLKEGFSELETPVSDDLVQDSKVDKENEDDLISDSELSDEQNGSDAVKEPQNDLEIHDFVAAEGIKKRPSQTRATSALFNAIMADPSSLIQSVMDKWVEEGNELTRSDISLVTLNFRKRRMYYRALQLSEWLDSTKRLDFDFGVRDYASRLDLIAKVHGLQKAENYIKKIPESFRGEMIYRTLLANFVAANNLKKAEEVFNKMKDLEFPITSFACNQLLLLYKRLDRKKIDDVLLLMQKENVKLTLFSYHVLIDTKGHSNDMTGMEKILESMKCEGIEPNLSIQAVLASHYLSGGFKEKAEAVLKEMEGDNIIENRRACSFLLRLYAALGKADEVGRIWKVCQSDPTYLECMAAIKAWGKLNKIEEAEAVFDRALKLRKKLDSKYYSMLLRVYANNKMLGKGRDLVRRMTDSGCQIGPLTWDALVNLYLNAGEVEKADSILHKATQKGQIKLLFSSYMSIMEHYSKKGDVRNTEKLFLRMTQAGFVLKPRQFEALLQAYSNAKAPAYGIRERMKAHNVFPNKYLAQHLDLVNPFRKTAISDLLD